MTKVNREDVSFCQSCYCSTHTIDGKCGKCGATKVNREWGEVFFEQMKTVRGLSASQYMKVRDIFEEIIPKVKSQTRNDLLREIMEALPKKLEIIPLDNNLLTMAKTAVEKLSIMEAHNMSTKPKRYFNEAIFQATQNINNLDKER